MDWRRLWLVSDSAIYKCGFECPEIICIRMKEVSYEMIEVLCECLRKNQRRESHHNALLVGHVSTKIREQGCMDCQFYICPFACLSTSLLCVVSCLESGVVVFITVVDVVLIVVAFVFLSSLSQTVKSRLGNST